MTRSRPDDGLRRLFKDNLEPLGFHMQSIETGGTGQGIPDTNFCARAETIGGMWKSVEGWIEYKATDHWSVTLRPEQIGWIERRVRCGGRVLIAVRRRHDGGPRVGPPVDELHLLPGHAARAARLEGLRGVIQAGSQLGCWVGGPSRWDWPAVARALVAG